YIINSDLTACPVSRITSFNVVCSIQISCSSILVLEPYFGWLSFIFSVFVISIFPDSLVVLIKLLSVSNTNALETTELFSQSFSNMVCAVHMLQHNNKVKYKLLIAYFSLYIINRLFPSVITFDYKGENFTT